MPALDVRRVGAHQVDDLGEDRAVAVVDLVVAARRPRAPAPSSMSISARDDAAHLVRREPAHLGEVAYVAQRRLLGQLARLLGDVADAWSPIRSSSNAT